MRKTRPPARLRPLPSPTSTPSRIVSRNLELLYLDPAIAVSDPIPLRARPVPPVIPDQTQYAGKSATHADHALARGIIGVVPIEEDGSVHFEMPAGMHFYMQALDERGMAVQTMRSATYLHPGERMSCIGCHESKNRSPVPPSEPLLALRRPPSQPQPEAAGSYPLSFPRLVQPVLDRKCVDCHEKNRGDGAPGLRGDVFAAHGHSEAHRSPAPFAWAKFGGNHDGITRNKTSYSIPGQV